MFLECLARSDMSVNDSTEFVCDRNIVVSEDFTYRLREDLSDPLYLENNDTSEPVPRYDWRFYKGHTICQTSGAGTGYQVRIRVHFGNGTDDGPDVYLQNGDGIPHCQVDFDDVQFWWDNPQIGWEQLKSWKNVVVTNDAHYADCWVKLKGDLSASDQEIRIYYGDIGANAANNTDDGDNTFEWIDDFEDGIIRSEWTNDTPVGTIVEENGVLSFSIDSSKDGRWWTGSDENGSIIYMPVLPLVPKWAAITQINQYDVTLNSHAGIMACDDSVDLRDDSHLLGRYNDSTHDKYVWTKIINDQGSYHQGYAKTRLPALLQIRDAGTWLYFKVLAKKKGSFYGMGASTFNPTDIGLFLSEWGSTDITVNFEFFAIRKSASTEPQHGDWSAEYPFMEGWAHRKAHTMKGSEGAGKYYLMQFIAHKYSNDSTHQDEGAHVYLGTDVKDDFSDVRFLDEISHITQKPNFLRQWRGGIWTENPGDDDEHLCTEFWVEIQESLDYDQNVYMYYGNPMATSDNEAHKAFEFFDDFIKKIGDGWHNKSGEYTIDDSVLKLDSTVKIYSDKTFGPGHAYHTRARFFHHRSSGFVELDGNNNPNFEGDLATWVRQQYLERMDVEDDGQPDIKSVNQDTMTWMTQSINWYSSSYLESFINGERTSVHETYVPDESIPIYLYTYAGDQYPLLEVDYVIVRKCVYPEPSHGVWGAEVVLDSVTPVWKYRQSHTITGSTGAGTDYQVNVLADRNLPSSSGKIVGFNYKCETDFSDVRFVNDDGPALLDYWCAWTSTHTASFWVEIPDDLDTNKDIYVYYGFEGAVSASDGDATFIFFDDFEDQDFDEWDTSGGGSWDIVNDTVRRGDFAAYCAGGVTGRTLVVELDDIQHGIMVHVWARAASDLPYAGWPCWGIGTSDAGPTKGFYSVSLYDGQICYYQGSYAHWPHNYEYDVNTWHEYELGMNPNTDKQCGYKDGWNMTRIDLKATDGTNTFASFEEMRVSSGSHTGKNLWIDDYYVRKYIENEPGHGSWSSEEVLYT